MRARCRCTISHGQSGSEHRTPGIRRETQSIGRASYSGLKAGRSVSAVEKAASAGLGKSSELGSSLCSSSSDLSDSILEHGVARSLHPARKSKTLLVTDSSPDSLASSETGPTG